MKFVYLIVFSFLGGMTRWIISSLFTAQGFPFTTLAINLSGCFLLAFIVQGIANFSFFSKDLITGLGTGFVGSYTTFSTFTIESIHFLQEGNIQYFIIYLTVSLFGGLLAARLGYWAGNNVFKLGSERY
ncbi:fluoride efflux transporter CrcB [Listeria monocytogenes]|jgi:CrcB protein|uniref:Fluoride-specific ion channel FluC n=3 Tax=Listeria monocytogenes TaxID=1639 RepID=A0AAP6TGZ6_LISMN|nr:MULTISPECIES: CrcB family protein [Listeria]EAE3716052.1 fluoride efflux transporter CrcB [Listeria monocytogenes serotype 1/2c]MDA56892.1 fluoride efflux transporter CrcB [Listeria monocytogenes serotype 4b]AGT06972.1 camphor resistance protein CrcB [Listeria monocytogenes]AGT07044.1 camphor resistance protein CrcB [Listeria monocytogenes]AGT07114.1 camphor resistance protein CrcB [Listeria monocytogenes]